METTEPMTLENAVEALHAAQEEPEAAAETTAEEIEVTDPPEIDAEDAPGAAEADMEDEGETVEAEADEATEDADTDEAEDAEELEEQLFTVTEDGRNKTVPLQELLDGYSGQAKVNEGLRTNADARKEIMAEAQNLEAQRRQFLEAYQAAQSQGFRSPPTPPDRSLIDTNATEYLRQKAEYDANLGAYQQEQATMAQLMQQQQMAVASRAQQSIQQEIGKLASEVPELGDPVKRQALANRMMEVATKEYGYSRDAFNRIQTGPEFKVLLDAVRFRGLQAEQAKAKTVPKRTKSVKPKGSGMSADQRKANAAQKKFQQTGSIMDAVNALHGG